MKLLISKGNLKINKGEAYGYLTAILHLSPSTLSGRNFCAHASPICRAVCLNTAGYGRFDYVQKARLRRSHLFINDREVFMAQLVREFETWQRRARKQGKKFAVRLNGTSDLPWHAIGVDGFPSIMEAFPSVQFYDYTVDFKRCVRWKSGKLPRNYYLCYSRKENNEALCQIALSLGVNVSVVFRANPFPPTYLGTKVIDGDRHDLRFLDEQGTIVGLSAKGKAKQDFSGFVV